MIRHDFPVMGTHASVHACVPDEAAATISVRALEVEMRRLEDLLTHYRRSGIGDYLEGLPVPEADAREIELVLQACLELESDSEGVFRAVDENGRPDTAGYVKGYAIGVGRRLLKEAGVNDFVFGIGGDCVVEGTREGKPWGVMVEDPLAPGRALALVTESPIAVATSGDYRRGPHIRNREDSTTVSFTVTGPDIALADAYATIGFAMGERGVAWVESRGYRALRRYR